MRRQTQQRSGGGSSSGSSEGRRELAFVSPASLIPTLIPAQHPVSQAVLELTLLQAPSRQPFLRSASSGTSKEEPEVSLLQPASLAALQQSLGSQGRRERGLQGGSASPDILEEEGRMEVAGSQRLPEGESDLGQEGARPGLLAASKQGEPCSDAWA